MGERSGGSLAGNKQQCQDKRAIVELKRLENDGHCFEPKATGLEGAWVLEEGKQPS